MRHRVVSFLIICGEVSYFSKLSSTVATFQVGIYGKKLPLKHESSSYPYLVQKEKGMGVKAGDVSLSKT